ARPGPADPAAWFSGNGLLPRGPRVTASVGRNDRGCYSLLRTRSQNPRGSTILMGASEAISRRSRSPVTNTSTRLSIAEATTHWSSGSRFGTAARVADLGAHLVLPQTLVNLVDGTER